MKEIVPLRTEEFTLATGAKVELRRWALVTPGEDIGDDFGRRDVDHRVVDRALKFYRDERCIHRRNRRVKCLLPFAEVIDDREVIEGTFANFGEAFVRGGEVQLTRRSLTEMYAQRQPLAAIVERYARLRMNLRAPGLDEVQTALVGLEPTVGGWGVTVGPSIWSNARVTMDAGEDPRTVIALREDDGGEVAELARELEQTFDRGTTVREAMRRIAGPSAGRRLVPFSSGTYAFHHGVGCVINCTKSENRVFTRRGRAVHVNPGRVYGAGGGVRWQKLLEVLERKSYFDVIVEALFDELIKEIGRANFRIVRTGFARELTREGSPEFFMEAEFDGSEEELLPIMAANEDPERSEIDRIVYSIRPEHIAALLGSPDGTQVIQRKGMATFYFAARHAGII